MTQVNNASQLVGYRSPTHEEVDGVSRIFLKYYSAGICLCKTATIILCALGLVLFSSFAQIGWGAVVFGTAAYAGAFFSITSKNRFCGYQKLFVEGSFQVLDGFVSEIGPGDGKPGFCNVRFTSNQGQSLTEWFGVRQEGVRVNVPLLLVYVDRTRIHNGVTWVFTPFMLSAEAEKISW